MTPEMPSLREFMLPDMDSTFRIFAAHLRRVRTDWSYPLHTHPLFEVNLVLSGTQEMTVDGKSYTQREGDIMLLRPGMQHGSRAADGGAEGSRIGGTREADMTYYCLHFDVDDPGLRELLFRHANPFHAAEGRLSAAIRPTLDKLIGLSAADTAFGAGHRMRVLAAVFELLAGLAETLAADEPMAYALAGAWDGAGGASGSNSGGDGNGSGDGGNGRRRGGEGSGGSNRRGLSDGGWDIEDDGEGSGGERSGGVQSPLAATIALRLERHVEGEGTAFGDADDDGEAGNTVAAIAARLGYSVSTCSRAFRRAYGISPRQYLSALILKKAKLLLLEPSLPVETVSARLGYRDIAHFSRQFKRWTGESPLKFRARFHS